MIIDTAKINELLASGISGDRIEADTGIGKKTISNYRTGNAKISNMTLETASKLCLFWDQEQGKKLLDIKITGVKKAVGDFNNWQGAARIYFDKQDLTVWTIVYAGPNEWTEYESSSIVEVASKATTSIIDRDNRITMRQLQEMCEAKLDEKG